MNEVGRTAIRIGEHMESVHQQRQRAQAAYDLIDFYNQFSRDDTETLDKLKKEGKEGRRKVAVLLRRLATVAKEVDMANADRVCLEFIQFASTTHDGRVLCRRERISIGIARSSRRTCCTYLTEPIGGETPR